MNVSQTAPKKKLTYVDLMTSAQSADPNERKRAHAIYRSWMKAAPQLGYADRLTYTERYILEQIFKQKGFA